MLMAKCASRSSSQYRRGKQTRRMKLDAGNALTAEQARAAAKAVLARVALGDDPQADRHGRRDARSLRSVADEFLSAKRARVRRPPFRAMSAYLSNGYFRPLYTTAIDQITRSRYRRAAGRHHARARCEYRDALSRAS